MCVCVYVCVYNVYNVCMCVYNVCMCVCVCVCVLAPGAERRHHRGSGGEHAARPPGRLHPALLHATQEPHLPRTRTR